MKFLRYVFPALALLFTMASVSGCKDPGESGTGDPIPSEGAYKTFRTKFNAATTGSWTTVGGGKYVVTFGSGNLILDDSEIPVTVCTPETWPALAVKNLVWHIDGVSTGIEFVADRSEERIVSVIYDGEGIYVRLSSGYMFYFHSNKTLDVGCFRFERALNPSLEKDVICAVDGDKISGDIGDKLPSMRLIPTFATRGDVGVTSTGQPLISSVSSLDWSHSVSLYLASGEKKQPYTVSLSRSEGSIPVLRIVTGKGYNSISNSNPRADVFTGTVTVEDPDLTYAQTPFETLGIEVHGRGNTTWGTPKKPLKIKLDEKKRLLGMSDNKHWVLLANYSDKSMMRNNLAFKMSEMMGMMWSPRWVPVEVYYDDTYLGVYMLTEHVREGAERVEIDIAESNHNSGEAVTGGYFMSIDSKNLDDKGQPGFKHKNRTGEIPFAFEAPENPTSAQVTYLKNYIRDVENAIYDKSFAEYSQIIDIESFIHYYFIHEIARDVDGNMRLSTYIAKPRGGKLFFPCVWDFDLAFGNCDYHVGYTEFTIRNAVWFSQLFRNKEFCDLVAQRWAEFYPRFTTEIEPFIRGKAAEIDEAQKRNFTKWPILGVYVWPNVNAESKKTYKAEVDDLIDFFNKRVEWLNTEIRAGRHRH